MKFTQSRVNALRPPAGKADYEEIDEGMPGFGIRYRNGGAGVYFVKYKIGGKHGRLSLGAVGKITLADAQAAARRHFAMVADKISPSTERAKAIAKVSDTIEPLIDDFLAYMVRAGRSVSHRIEVERSLRRYFEPLHHFSAGDINRAMVAKLLSTIRADHGPIAADRAVRTCRNSSPGRLPRATPIATRSPAPTRPAASRVSACCRTPNCWRSGTGSAPTITATSSGC